ncbi:hypothetical protein FTX61_14515 [Nitriliruptoraceae bacterium ZYF776]|nr:hypothetical protein [Profundirhabdus halotolerans]
MARRRLPLIRGRSGVGRERPRRSSRPSIGVGRERPRRCSLRRLPASRPEVLVRSPVTFALVAAAIAGTLIAFQTALIGVFGSQVHPFVAATWVHGAGLVFGIVGVLALRLGFEFDVVRAHPLGLLAGVAGMLLVTAMAVAVGGAGLATTLAVVTAVQLLVGFGLEASGLLGRAIALDPVRLLGAALIVGGVVLVAGRGQAPT